MAASPHAWLGPLPAAPHHRRTRRTFRARRGPCPGRTQRLFAAAVLGLTLPLAAASAAVAMPSPSAEVSPSPRPFPVPGAGVGGPGSAAGPAGPESSTASRPSAPPPRHPLPRPHLDGDFPRAHRHHPASLPERPGAAVERVPDRVPEQAPDQAVEQAPEQAPDQTPEQAQDQGVEVDRPEADPDSADPAAPGDAVAPDTVTAASGQPVTAAAIPIVLPARWQDASTTQLPLGVGLGLIGCGLGLVGLRLRRG